MPSLKDLRNRIESVKSTRKITKAMQMVAAAKLRRAQEVAEAARPYASVFADVLARLAQGAKNAGTAPPLLAGTGETQTHLLVVMSAERGLCGGFNSSIAKRARQYGEEITAQGGVVKILTIGKKGREQLKRGYKDAFVGHFDFSEAKMIEFSHAHEVAADIIARFENGEFDVATIFFNRFESIVNQVPTAQQLIPFSIEMDENAADDANPQTEAGAGAALAEVAYDYEPDSEEILSELLPRAITTQIFAALMENGASEQGARMSAMDNATRNAGEMIDKLTIQFNRSRQAVITNELIEIISGAEAL